MKYFSFLFALLLALAVPQVSLANSCRALFVTGGIASSAQEPWESIDGDNQARALKSDSEINAFVIETISQAQTSLELQSLKIGQDIAMLLIEKAKQGVNVRVQVSEVDALNTSKEKRSEAKSVLMQLRQTPGVILSEYDRQSLLRQAKMPFPEMHKKLLIADNVVAYLGNKNLNQHTDGIDFGLALRGPLVKELRSQFYQDLAQSERDADLLTEVLSAAVNSKVNILNSYELKKTLLKNIDEAKESILISHVEFNDPQVVEALIQKKKSHPGVEIKIITKKNIKLYHVGPYKFERPLNLDVLTRLNENNIKVFELKSDGLGDSHFHGKLVILDGQKIIVGSSDLNKRSLEGNAELDIEVHSPYLAREFTHFLEVSQGLAPASFNYTLRQKIFSKVYNLHLHLMAKVHKVKRMFLNKMNLSPEFLDLQFHRTLGHFHRWFLNFGIISAHDQVRYRSLDQVLKALGTRVSKVEKINPTTLIDGEDFFVFVGSTEFQARRIQKVGMGITRNGHFGEGYYFATDYPTALRYSALRA